MSGRKGPRGEKVERRKRKTQKIRKPILFAGISARLKDIVNPFHTNTEELNTAKYNTGSSITNEEK